MDKKIGLFWLRDDFRFVKNLGLIEATTKHNQVVVFYLYKKDIFDNQEGQKWWLSKSLLNFKKKLNELNITLEIVETSSFKIFFGTLRPTTSRRQTFLTRTPMGSFVLVLAGDGELQEEVEPLPCQR